MARSRSHPSKTRVARAAIYLVLLTATCGDAAPPPGETAPEGSAGGASTDAADSARDPVDWTATELPAPRGFRAYGWGAGDSLWGIARGRLAMASLTGDTMVAPAIAWGAGTAPGHDLAWWTGEDGVFERRGGRDERLTAAAPPTAEHLGPEVLWSPDGSRALLTWTAEAGSVHTLLEGDGQQVLSARIPGYRLGAGALWVDAGRVLMVATANGPRAGPAGHREAGYRADLAVLDVASDRATLVTAGADGEFLVPEGLPHPDTLLVGLRRGAGEPGSHLALDTRTWTLTPRLDLRGRAAAAHGIIALLEPVAGPGEPAWRLVLVTRGGTSGPLATIQGHAVRLLWHPRLPILAVATESETAAGTRTLIVR